MKYFSSVVDFVDEHILWVVALFLLVSIVELIVFLFKIKDGGFDTDSFFVCIVTNIIIFIGIYMLACLGVGLVNCIKDQDYHFWANYKVFMAKTIGKIILVVVFGIFVGLGFFVFFDESSFVFRVLFSIGAAIFLTFVAYWIIFAIFIVVSFVIILFKVLWFVVSGFFISIFQFVIRYWKYSIIALLSPGVIYGGVCAFANYLRSFIDEVVDK